MDTLTLNIDQNVIKKAEVYAKNANTTVPKLIEEYLLSISSNVEVDYGGIPFPVQTGNKGFGGLSINEVTDSFNNAVKEDIAKKHKKGLPVARYDIETRRAYLENADGTREYV